MDLTKEEDVGEKKRTVVYQSTAVIGTGWKKKKRYLTLFNDVLIISSKLNKKKFKTKHVIPLTYLWVGDEVDAFRSDNTAVTKSIHLYWLTGHVVATFCSMEQTTWWYFFLQRSVREAKKHNKIEIPLEIFTEDIACCDTPLYVTATNFDTVNDIISKLLPMIKHGTEGYQLWFCPGPREAPKALQGHEYTHDIIMINIQKNFSSRDLKNFKDISYLPGILMKYLNADVHWKFILKPRNSARSQQQKNMKKITFKKQRSSVTWQLDGASVPHQDKVCTIPQVKKGGKLFGRELSSICQDGDLPSAILDMLYVLKKKGPTTKGVFIEPPSTTLFQTVKDKLDSGEEVDIEKQSVHVVAWIFKDFLQNIEGSLMTSKLYDEWIAVTENVNDEEKLAAVQSLLDKMPPENAALLRQLFRILYEIKNHSSINKMSSYHLSVGLAPCLLFVPSFCNNGEINDIAKKISLLKFMIENSPQFFGEDLAAVWQGTSLYHRPGAKSSCSQSTPTNSGNVKETKHGLSSSPSGRTCTPGYNTLRRNSAALLPYEGIIDSQKHEVNIYTNPTVPSLNPPQAKKKCLFGKSLTSLFKDKKLPAPIVDMLSIIAEKGPESDHIFKSLPKESHWSLRYRLDNEQQIDWDKECVLVIASVLKDFIVNIDGSLLTLSLYENWLCITDERTMTGKINAIQSLLQQIPEPNFILLKHLICVLEIIKDSSMNNLDSYRLSHRIAPNVLLGTSRISLFGNDVLRKMSIIQIMIDNYQKIFGNNDMFIKYIDNKSDDLRMRKASINFSGKSPVMSKVMTCYNWKTCGNNKKNILCAALQEERPTEKYEGKVYTNPPVRCLFPLRPAKKCLFKQPLMTIFEDRELHTPIIDFIFNIDGTSLTLTVYENWLCIPEEGTLAEKINVIQSHLHQIPEPNFILLKYLICLLVMVKDSSMNNLDRSRLSVCIAPCGSRGLTSRNSLLGNDILRKLSVIQIMIDNYHKIFGNDDMFNKHIEKKSDDLRMLKESKNSSVKSPVMTKVIACYNWKACGNNKKNNISCAALQEESPTEKYEGKVYTNPPVRCLYPLRPAKKCLFNQPLMTIFENKELHTPIIDFIINIDGTSLTLTVYENWLCVPEEGTLAEKINVIQSHLHQIPEPNFVLLKYLICLLVMVKDSSMNNLDRSRLSVCIAPCGSRGLTSRDSLFGNDILRKKLSVIQIMIDNYHKIFGNEDIFNKHIDKKSDDLRMLKESKNSSVISPVMTKVIACYNWKACGNNKKNNISCAALQEESPTEKYEGKVYTNPPVCCLFPLRPATTCLFPQPLTSVFEDKKVHTPIIDYIINMDSTSLTLILYENWLCIPEKGTLSGKFNVIQSLFQQVPEPNFILLKHLLCALTMLKDYSMNNLDHHRLSVRIAPRGLRGQTSRDSLFGTDILREDFIINIDSTTHTLIMYENWLCIPEKGTLSGEFNAIESLFQQVPESNFILLKHLLCALTMLKDSSMNNLDLSRSSVRIAPHGLRGQTLRDLLFGTDIFIKDFIINIDSTTLTLIQYENWLCIPEKGTLSGEFNAIESLFQQVPESNFILLKHLLCALTMLKDSSMNNLDLSRSSVRIAPRGLRGQTLRDSLFGTDIFRKDFIINIDSTTLTLIQYENWLCIPEKGTLSGEFNAIESLFQQVPESNFILLKHLLCALTMLKDSSMNNLDLSRSSVRIAPRGLRGQTLRDSLFGTDIFRKDFIINIDSTTLTLIQYENWLCIPEKGTLSGEFNAIESLFQQVPESNFILLKHLLCALTMLKDSSMNNLDLSRSSVRIAPRGLRGQTLRDSLFGTDIFRKDFIINIDSTTLTLIQYENWLCIPEKGTLSGEFNAIESLFQQVPESNFILLKHLLCALTMLKDSSMNNLDISRSSVRIAPRGLRGQTLRDSLFGTDIFRKDFNINIDSTTLTLIQYENWLCIPEKGTLSGEFNAIESLFQQVPESNFILLKHLLFALTMLKDSSMNNLDLSRSSVRIALHGLRGQTLRDSLFGTDIFRKDFIINIDSTTHTLIMYENWLCIPEKGTLSGEFNDIESLCQQVPESNFILLKHLLCALTMLKDSSMNNLDLSRLSVCIAPRGLRGQTLRDSLFGTDIFRKDFIINIDSTTLTLILYENWLCIPEKGTLSGKCNAISSSRISRDLLFGTDILRKGFIINIDSTSLTLIQYENWLCIPEKGTLSGEFNAIERLSLPIAPGGLRGQTSRDSLFGTDILRKISLMQIMIHPCHQIFGNDDILFKHIEKSSEDLKKYKKSLNSSGESPNMTKTIAGHNLNPCDKYEKFSISHSSLQEESPTEKQKGNIYTKPPVYSNPTPSRKKCLFGKNLTSIFVDSKLPAPILDILSVIAEKGQESDQIFEILPENSHWSLRERIDGEELIDWNEESVLVTASVLMDFITNIEGSLLTSDLYENWLSVSDEGSLVGKINIIQRLLLKIPQANFILLKYFIRVLVIIRESSMNNLDSNSLSNRIAPYVLWNQTTKNTLFGSDVSRKMSVIQIMIDNYHEIFGNDNIFCKGIDKRSGDLKMCTYSINSSGKSPITKEFLGGCNRKTCDNRENFKISSIALREEGPIGQNRTTTTYKWWGMTEGIIRSFNFNHPFYLPLNYKRRDYYNILLPHFFCMLYIVFYPNK
ncbi:uncharacterized protein Tgap1l1 isoform X3 [Rattus norvegicus]|uniref:uncharacterized protein Tgap1l1 isoform X3 n=1 Tax=Rattus norvegicus TaxID=10116 RepID=UPI0019171933|nr:uncharacterized protein LOC100910852 isoform X3 [Rattus norvegicus]